MEDKIEFVDSSEVRLLMVNGTEDTILEAARISYRSNQTQTSTPEKDRKLLRYLLKNKHTSPFEQVSFQFYIDTPLFVIQQLLRHRTFKFNQTSARYSEMEPRFFVPKIEDIRGQSKDNKQARSGEGVLLADAWKRHMEGVCYDSYGAYESLLQANVAKEIARMVLPVNLMSQLVVTCDLRNLIHFLQLRLHPHAQLEIREVAQKMLVSVEDKFPTVFEYLKETDNVFKESCV